MRKPWLVLLLVSCIVLVVSIVSLYMAPPLLQSQILRPKAEEIKIDTPYALELVIEGTSVSSPLGTAKVNLRAVNPQYFKNNYVKILDGRLPYVAEKGNVAVLDKESALKIYPSASPIGNIAKIGDKYYTVIGVIDHAPYNRQANVYTTVQSVIANKLQPDMASYFINSKVQSTSAFLHSDLPEGTVWDIAKEAERAILPLKWIAYFVMLLLCGFAYRKLMPVVKKQFAHLQALHQDLYASQFVPQIVLFVLLCLVGYGAIIAALAYSLWFIVGAIVKFPEYLPEILVDFKMIYQTFQNNLEKASKLIVVKSDLLVHVEYYARLISIFTPLLLFSICTCLFYERKPKHEKN